MRSRPAIWNSIWVSFGRLFCFTIFKWVRVHRQKRNYWVRSKIPEYISITLSTIGQVVKCALVEAVLRDRWSSSWFLLRPHCQRANGYDQSQGKYGYSRNFGRRGHGHQPDELSNMTNISYFCDYLNLEACRREAELAERTPVPAKCIVFGPGIEPELIYNRSTQCSQKKGPHRRSFFSC